MKKFTGLLDKNRKEIYEGDILRSGMRRSDDAGWTTERVVRVRGFFWFLGKHTWQLEDLRTGERSQMQYDQELRELVSETL